jgi:L-2-hydroxyglutarate oxidase LhgO
MLSAHELMTAFYRIFINPDHDYLFKSKVVESKIISGGYKTKIKNPVGEIESVTSQWVINCGGLNSDIIARLVKDNSELPFITFSKGCYFKLNSNCRNKFKHLVYPVPDKKNGGLGIHLSYDKEGFAKLGPDARWIETLMSIHIF